MSEMTTEIQVREIQSGGRASGGLCASKWQTDVHYPVQA
jgi:hypothetical protein